MKSISFEKERIQNIALYFVQNTKYVGIKKLCKLFYFLDMDAYIDHGFTVTGLMYYAKKLGPVPMSIWADLQDRRENGYLYYDLATVIKREEKKSVRADDGERFFEAQKRAVFNSEYFSTIELDLLKKIVETFACSSGNEMSELSHLAGKPWEQTWNHGEGDGHFIDFDLEAELHYNTEEMDNRRFVKEMSTNFKAVIEAL